MSKTIKTEISPASANPALATLPLDVIVMSSVSLNLSVAVQAFPDGPLAGSMPGFLPAHHLCVWPLAIIKWRFLM